MPADRHHIVATAGHIDHGKSTLVEALTGTNPDRLPEEKRRGMTIELGFAHLQLAHPEDPGSVIHVGMIDVPGHSDFIRNMVAGLGAVDAALFVVAADDGWMPQTEEHLQILTYLGVRDAVMALTKSDLAIDLDSCISRIRWHLADSPFENATIVPVCALLGEGLGELKTALAEALLAKPCQADIGKPRLFVDRAFSPRGLGTIVTGTLTGGCLSVGEELLLMPQCKGTKARAIQNHGSAVERSQPGMRTAVQLQNIELAVSGAEHGVRRGDVLTSSKFTSAKPSLEVDVLLHRLARSAPPDGQAGPAVCSGNHVWIHHGSASLEAVLIFMDSDTEELEHGRSLFAQIRFASPAFVFAGDRFVVRDWSKQRTLAGGMVLDPQSRPRHFRRPGQRLFLERRSASPNDIAVLAGSLAERDHVFRAEDLLLASYSESGISDAIAKHPDIEQREGWLLHRPWWQEMLQAAANAIRGHLCSQPESIGLKLTQLRNLIEPRLQEKRLFEPLIEALIENGFTRLPGVIRPADHVPRLPPDLREAGEHITKALAEEPNEPPGIKALVRNPQDQKALKFFIETGEVIQIDEANVLAAAAFERACSKVRLALKLKKSATTSELRQAIGTSRRIAMPVLEIMDKRGITIREGDLRRLRG